MAVLDASRTAVELSREELDAAAALVTGNISNAVALEALEVAGVVRNGAIVPFVGRFLMIVAEPKLRLVVERFIAERVVVDEVWAVERLAVGSEVRGGGIELRPVEPPLLPWEIMRTVGLGPRARPALDAPVRVAAATLEEVERLLFADNDAEAAASLLTETTQLAGSERAVVLDVLRRRRSGSWRASSIYNDVDGQRSETVTVLDGGDAGLWITTAEGSEQDPIVCLEPVLPSAVWRRLVGLVPGAPEVPEDFADFDD